jgi:large subunit ribosomal protein L1
MMNKRYQAAKERVEPREYALDEAIALLLDLPAVKFTESVDLSMRLGVDPKYPDQMVRGTVVLPHGVGRVSRVLVLAQGEKQKEALEAGADYAGADELIDKIQKENWFEFDVMIATPDMMRLVGKLGKVLGPKGLMPSPKAGTVTFNVKEAVEEVKKGRIEFRVDKTGIINGTVGKRNFEKDKLSDNITEYIQAVMKAKPAAVKGKYVRSIYLSSTMSPSIKLAPVDFERK